MSTRTARRGFTLLEIAVVLGISTIAALLVFPQWAEQREAPMAPPAQVAAWLAEARQQAIGARQTVTVHLDARAAQVQMDTSGASGSGVWLREPLSRELSSAFEPPSARLAFEFRATGAARGDTVRVRTSDGIWRLTIDRWSGEVQYVAP